jgi:hypothetical protein
MGQQKGNPIPSVQNQAYEELRPNTGARENRDYGTKPVMIDDTTTLNAVIDATFATDSSIQPLMLGKTDLSAASGSVTYDCSNGQRVFSHFGVNASANWQANFTNLPMSNNEAHYITVISSNANTNGHTWFMNGMKINDTPAIWTASWTNGAKNTFYIYKFVIVNTVSGPVVYGDRITTTPQ